MKTKTPKKLALKSIKTINNTSYQFKLKTHKIYNSGLSDVMSTDSLRKDENEAIMT